MISIGMPKEKSGRWACSDAEVRKRGERTGLDTPVVHAVNDVHVIEEVLTLFSVEVKTLSAPPGEYGRKAKTQRN